MSSSPATLPGSQARVTPSESVQQMVLQSGDVSAYELQDQGGEKLREQFPSAGTPHRKAVVALVRKNWLASRHSVLLDQSNNYRVLSDVNLFKTAAAAHKIWKLEIQKKGVTRLQVPTGAPPKSVLFAWVDGGDLQYWLGWQRDRVIAYVALSSDSGTTDAPSATAIQSLNLAAHALDAKVRGALLIASPNA